MNRRLIDSLLRENKLRTDNNETTDATDSVRTTKLLEQLSRWLHNHHRQYDRSSTLEISVSWGEENARTPVYTKDFVHMKLTANCLITTQPVPRLTD